MLLCPLSPLCCADWHSHTEWYEISSSSPVELEASLEGIPGIPEAGEDL